jgi:hypothetical protein
MHVAYGLKSVHRETMVGPAGTNAVSTVVPAAMLGLVETVSQPASSVTPTPLEFTITADKGIQDGMLTAVKNRSIYRLVAWLVEHPAKRPSHPANQSSRH